MATRARALRSAHVRTTASDHRHTIGVALRAPVGYKALAGRHGVGRHHDAASLGIAGDRHSWITRSELVEGLALPRRAPAAVLGQLDGQAALDERAECPARLKLGELVRVTDEHELAARVIYAGHEVGQLAGADHGGLVDDDDHARREPAPGEDGRHAGAGNTGAGLQLTRRSASDRRSPNRVPRCLPGIPGGRQGERLARAGLADDDCDATAAPA
jgi:hypothetical protein